MATKKYKCCFCGKAEIWEDAPQSYLCCRDCYFDKLCLFCKPPVPEELCKGHKFGKHAGNRFLNDPFFTKNVVFEKDSKG